MFYSVMLLSVGSEKIKTIKIYRELSGVSLYEAKRDVENPPIKVAGGLSEEDAHTISAALRQLGNTTSIERDIEAIIPNDILRGYDIYKEVSTADPFSYNYSKTDYSDPWDKSNEKKAEKERKKAEKKEEKLRRAQLKEAAKLKKQQNKVRVKETSLNARNDKLGANTGAFKAVVIVAITYVAIGFFACLGILAGKKTPPPMNIETIYPSTPSYFEGEKLSKDDILEAVGTSIVFNYFAQDAFGKNITELSDKELKSVIYIDYNYDDDYKNMFLEYKLSDNTEGRITVPQESFYVEYFSIFPNIEYLDSKEISETRSKKVSFKNLKHIGYQGDVWDTLHEDVDTEKITSINVYRTMYPYDLTIFDNLEEVTIDAGYNPLNLNQLLEIPRLRSLTIKANDLSADDLKVISSLTSLEELYLYCDGLKDIRFIENLSDLKVLSLNHSKVINIDSVEKIGHQLDELYLLGNYSIDDYTFIGELTNLKKLGLEDSFEQDDAGKPDLSRLTELEELYFGRPYDLSNLQYLSKLKKLTLYYPYGHDFNFLYNMPGLKELHIHNGSLYASEIYTIAECNQIEELCLNYTFVWDDISCVLNMPNVKKLNLENASFGIMLDKVMLNQSIEYINMHWAKIYSLDDDGQFYYDNSIIGLEPVAPVFAKLQALKEINVHGHMLTEADVFKHNKQLHMIDISSSYIVDLKPIADLPLCYIVCESTQMYDYAGFGEMNIIKD